MNQQLPLNPFRVYAQLYETQHMDLYCTNLIHCSSSRIYSIVSLITISAVMFGQKIGKGWNIKSISWSSLKAYGQGIWIVVHLVVNYSLLLHNPVSR